MKRSELEKIFWDQLAIASGEKFLLEEKQKERTHDMEKQNRLVHAQQEEAKNSREFEASKLRAAAKERESNRNIALFSDIAGGLATGGASLLAKGDLSGSGSGDGGLFSMLQGIAKGGASSPGGGLGQVLSVLDTASKVGKIAGAVGGMTGNKTLQKLGHGAEILQQGVGLASDFLPSQGQRSFDSEGDTYTIQKKLSPKEMTQMLNRGEKIPKDGILIERISKHQWDNPHDPIYNNRQDAGNPYKGQRGVVQTDHSTGKSTILRPQGATSNVLNQLQTQQQQYQPQQQESSWGSKALNFLGDTLQKVRYAYETPEGKTGMNQMQKAAYDRETDLIKNSNLLNSIGQKEGLAHQNKMNQLGMDFQLKQLLQQNKQLLDAEMEGYKHQLGEKKYANAKGKIESIDYMMADVLGNNKIPDSKKSEAVRRFLTQQKVAGDATLSGVDTSSAIVNGDNVYLSTDRGDDFVVTASDLLAKTQAAYKNYLAIKRYGEYAPIQSSAEQTNIEDFKRKQNITRKANRVSPEAADLMLEDVQKAPTRENWYGKKIHPSPKDRLEAANAMYNSAEGGRMRRPDGKEIFVKTDEEVLLYLQEGYELVE